MDIVIGKLNLITDVWNSVILEHTYAQNKINFNSEKETNYFGEIMHYLIDTFPIILEHKEKKNQNCSFHEYIFYNIGILQILYLQQDLIDEMLEIFSLNRSLYKDRKHIRELRNELIGHPISRDSRTRKLKSSVFWLANPPLYTKELDHSKIQYRKYESGQWESATRHSEDIDILISMHTEYLNKYFDLILNKEKKIIKEFENKLKPIINMLSNELVDEKLVFKLSFELIPSISNYSYIFSEKYIKKAYEKIEMGERYKYYLDYCFKTIKENIIDILDNFKKYKIRIEMALNSENQNNSNENAKSSDGISSNIKLVRSSSLPQNVNDNDKKSNENRKLYPYYLSKLVEKKYLDLIDLLIDENRSNSSICFELNNMKLAHFEEDDFEYYISFVYVSKLLLEV